MTGLMREDKGRQTVQVTDIIDARVNNNITELRKEAAEIGRIKADEAKTRATQDSKIDLDTDSSEKLFSLTDFLNDTEPEVLADLFKVEHPQTIALILAHIANTGKTGQIIEHLPQTIRADITYRLAILKSIPPGVFKEIGDVIGSEVQSGRLMPGKDPGGIKPAGQSLRSVNPETALDILSTIKKSDPDLADQLEASMKDPGE